MITQGQQSSLVDGAIGPRCTMGHCLKFMVCGDDLERMYSEGMKTKDIASRYGVCTQTVLTWAHRYDIKTERDRSKYSVHIPKEVLREMYIDKHMTADEIGAAFGCSDCTVRNRLIQYDISLTPDQLSKRAQKIRAKKYPLRTKSSGYWHIVKRDHPSANKEGYVLEHIVLAEGSIGRYLKDGEVVHHVNMNKGDNRPENLAVLPSMRDHLRLHRYFERIGAYMTGFLKERPVPIEFDEQVFFGGRWVNEIDLIGDREPIRTDLGKGLFNDTSVKIQTLVN